MSSDIEKDTHEKSLKQKFFNVLLLENDSLDAIKIKKFFSKVSDGIKMVRIGDGYEALDFLRNKERYKSFPEPDVIILDVNLPYIDGYQILDFLKVHPKHKTTPLIVVMPSNNQERPDQRVRYLNNTNSIKPDFRPDFEVVLAAVDRYLIG